MIMNYINKSFPLAAQPGASLGGRAVPEAVWPWQEAPWQGDSKCPPPHVSAGVLGRGLNLLIPSNIRFSV